MSSNPTIQPPTKKEAWVIRIMILLGCLSIINFVYWFTQEEFRSYAWLYFLLSFTLLYGILRNVYMWYHYLHLSVPDTPPSSRSFTVDILTTYFPGEPYEMIEETLRAIQKITYPHTTYLCDEANDPHLIELCKNLGVIHVIRNNRINAKAGNINNALKQAKGEICVILDPDHVPYPNFLDPVIPHFNNPEIGFVQIVQAYYNHRETLVARGAAEQTYQFYGPMMMTMNSYGTVNAIGANCTFRRKALNSIGGHAPGLSEDMHTAMLLHARGWKSVYVPKILARGLVPSDLTAYYKQQLKWSRGTFDLLFYVYPRLFRNFSWRQKLHYGLLPLHFLVGTVYLFSFLIPILSLILARLPWSGNILFFGLFYLPLGMSGFLIRAYIQKWVMEKNERGFHLMGGLLQITTWWIYFLGFIYTIFKKKIPYLPTPKIGDAESNYKIILPNIIVGNASVLAVIYGLYIDFTPFSVVMSAFALLNAFFMFFSIFLVTQKTNKNNILRTTLPKDTVIILVRVKGAYRKFSDFLFRLIRPVALPALIVVFILSFVLQNNYLRSKWEDLALTGKQDLTKSYLGIFIPGPVNNGLPDFDALTGMERTQRLKFDMVSLYLPWGDRNGYELPKEEIRVILNKKRIPLITWEPWASTFIMADSIEVLKNEKNILQYINTGHFDDYLRNVARYLKSLETPVFLRFAHEFDNPQYPWSPMGNNSPADFIQAWKRVHLIFQEEQAEKVVWVWNPWKAESITQYYPGDDYVDWIGVTGLNYGTFNSDAQWHEFRELYLPYHSAIKNLTGKPVMLAEFGSLSLGGDKRQWMENAFKDIDTQFDEIKGVVIFNSGFDKNLPPDAQVTFDKLDWSIDSLQFVPDKYRQPLPEFLFDSRNHVVERKATNPKTKTLAIKPFRAVKYKKGQNWLGNNFVPRRQVILQDFNQMKDLGFNTVQYSGPGIYDQNVLTYSKKVGLSLVYSFWIPHTMDFVTDTVGKQELKQRILTAIKHYREYDHIIAWDIGNDTWRELENTYNQPVLLYQRKAYMNWLSELTAAIKEADRHRPLLLSMHLDEQSIKRIREMRIVAPQIDAYGMIPGEDAPFTSFIKQAENDNIPFTISDISVGAYKAVRQKIQGQAIVIGNWQDQWESDLVSFDGLLDFEGRRKEAFYELEGVWSDRVITRPDLDFRILKPSRLLYPEVINTYHLVLRDNDEWVYPQKNLYEDRFEWYLVKTDEYGNKLGLKKLGKGVSKTIKIPEGHEFYELMVSYFVHDMVSSRITSLNTPLEP